MQYIIFQIVFFCVLLLYAIKSHKQGISKLILAEWIVSSIFTLVYTILMFQGHVYFNYIPVLYWDICFLLYFMPILGIEVRGINVSEKFVNYSINILTFLGLLSLLPLVENLIYLITNYTSQSSAILDMYENKMDIDNSQDLTPWFSSLGKFLYFQINRFFYPAFIVSFIIATKRQKIPTYKLLLALCIFLTTICSALNSSARGTVVELFMMAFAFYLLLRNQFILHVPTRLKVYMLSIAGGVIACMIVLSLIRIGDQADEELKWISYSLYLGEGQVNFFESMWECKASAMGDYGFSYIKDLLGFDTFPNYLERREYWHEGIVGYDPVRFYTFIGGWFADFRYFTILFIVIISYLFRKLINKSNGIFTPLSLYIIFIYINILLMGFAVFNFMVYQKFRGAVISFIYLYILHYLTKEKK